MIEEKKKEIKPLTAEDQLYVKELVWQLNGTIRRVVRSYLDDDLSAEFDDVVQSIFETICKQLDDFRNADSPEALAVRIATRRVWHVRRDWKATEELSEDYAATDDGPRGLDDILPKSFPPSDKALLNSVYGDKDPNNFYSYNAYEHGGDYSFTGVPGVKYRAVMKAYASNSSGSEYSSEITCSGKVCK